MNSLRGGRLTHWTPLLHASDWRGVLEVWVIPVLTERIALDCKRSGLLLIHGLGKLIESNALVCIDIESTDDSDNLRLRGVPAVHATEIHDVVVVEEALASVVDGLEGSHVRPVNSALKIVLQ